MRDGHAIPNSAACVIEPSTGQKCSCRACSPDLYATHTRVQDFETGWKPADKCGVVPASARLLVGTKPLVTSNESGGARAR